MTRHVLYRCLASAVTLCLSGIIGAADVQAQLQQLPGAAEPGRQAPTRLAPPGKPAPLEWSVQLPPGAEPPPSLKSEKLELKDVRLVGVTVYRRDQLAALFAPFLGREITFDQFYGLSRAIQQRYREDGYILSFAYIPPQTVEDGVYTIAVVEGFVERVEVDDVDGTLQSTLRDLLEPISRVRPLDVATLERYLLLANDMAGLKVTGVLRPSRTTRGASVLVAKVRRNPVSGGATLDNRGSEFTGTWQSSANISANSLFGTGERLTVGLSEASFLSEKKGVSASYSQPLGNDGLRFDQAVTYTETTPGFTLKQFRVETTSVELTSDLSYPVIRSRAETLTVGGGLTYRDSTVDLLDAPFTRDRIRLLRSSVNYSDSGFLGGSSRLAFGIAQAVPVLDATESGRDTTSRADSNPYFTKATVDIVHARPLYEGVELRLSATGQLARAPLPASEEFSAGGDSYGRAYNSGEISGEDGVGLSAELNYDPGWRLSPFRYLQPYGFYDYSKAWDRRSSSSTGSQKSISSAGLGVRAGLPFGITLRLEFAYPLTSEPSNQVGESLGRFFGFLSWSY